MWHCVIGLVVRNISDGHGAFTCKGQADHEEFFLDPLKLSRNTHPSTQRHTPEEFKPS